MEIPFFLAMTAEELRGCSSAPERMAWMACHFSPYAAGLTDLPKALPPRSLLILDDCIPIHKHDPQLIVRQLKMALAELNCAALLLDFQREDEPKAASLAKQICSELRCPVAVSEAYAKVLDCPVFLAPLPPHLPPQQLLSPWQGRELWLDAACTSVCLTVTESGCERSLPTTLPTEGLHHDKDLCCHYSITVQPEKICFTLFRTKDDLADLTKAISPLGVTHAVGLFQELGPRM